MPLYSKKKFKFKKEDVKPARSTLSSRYHITYYFYSMFASKQKANILNLFFLLRRAQGRPRKRVLDVFEETRIVNDVIDRWNNFLTYLMLCSTAFSENRSAYP
jgi:hypothetical protein